MILNINTLEGYKSHLTSKLKSGKRITAKFQTKAGEVRKMTCSIAPEQNSNYPEGMFTVIEHTSAGDKFKAFNMDTLINE